MKAKHWFLTRCASVLCLAYTFPVSMAQPTNAEQKAKQILDAAGVKGGLVVHIGCGDGKLTASLRANDRFVVHGLGTDRNSVRQARNYVRSLGIYGNVSVDTFNGKDLPYIDNVVNLVVSESLGKMSMDEVLRVLCPLGVAYIGTETGWQKTTKRWPDDIDEWTHYLHGPDNNCLANDTVVAPPTGLQWVGGPLWSRAHSTLNGTSCMVSASGRVFTIEDLAPIELPLMPGKYTLVARDAFNGIALWQRPLESWESITHWMKPTPVQLTRRLVAASDRVYATLGIFSPVTAVDAATGDVLKVYDETEKTQEIIYADDVLYVVTGDPMNPYRLPKETAGYRANYAIYGKERYAPQRLPKDVPETAIAAVDALSGQILWRKSGEETAGYQATTLAVRGNRLAFQTESDLVFVDRVSGRTIWRKQHSVDMNSKTQHPGGASPTLVLCETLLLRADAKELIAFSTRDGSRVWRRPATLTYHSSPDIFVIGNVVWSYPSTEAYDLSTGKVVASRRETRDKPMGHDRCYRNKATVNYMINSRSGGADFSRLDGDYSLAHPWVRGTCSLGIMPCNGLLYASPHACSCVNETILYGFHALHGRASVVGPENHLERGPAYGRRTKALAEKDDWPTYRRDATRSACTQTELPSNLAPLWSAAVRTPTAPVVAAGRVLVAAKDAHTLHSLRTSDGTTAWTFTAGARIDSPPTVASGLVVFGSADGWVYCLDADSGALAWRFRAAPDARTTVAFGQLESLWPVSGSALVRNDTVYVVAGRHSFLDGGLFLYGLDLLTGRKKYEAGIAGPVGQDGESIFDGRQIKGNRSDILVSEGDLIYLRHMAFTPELKPVEKGKDHVLAVSGFLDDSGHHRSYWTLAPRLIYDTSIADYIDADLLVKNGSSVFGTRISASNRGPEAFDARSRGFVLFALTRDSERAA
ncbi:MAG: outer membrane protein assembly factor BamB family protein, partial [Planctomycetota bacterium]